MEFYTYSRVGNEEQLKNDKLKVAIYPRVSTQMQKENGISLDAQKNELIEYCNKNGYDYELFEEPKRNKWKKH